MAHVSLGGHAEAAPPAHTAHLRLAHQAGNALAAGHNACVSQLSADARHAVGFITGYKRLTDLCRQSDVGPLALTHRALQPAAEAAGGSLQRLAHGAHR
ncbi:MAG: hypothetical protein Q7K57_57950 [Burkholderiaceae bacterium]|nr:hypothetical protein [Burkholderiaceae bacterium]